MAGFLYFVPRELYAHDGNHPSENTIEKLGIADRFDVGPGLRDVKGGVLLRDKRGPIDEQRLCLDAAQERIEMGNGVVLLWWPDEPPRECELRRPEMIEGSHVKLEDGALWVVPTLRYNGKAFLPRAIGRGGREVVHPKYRPLDQFGDRLYKQWEARITLSREGVDLSIQEGAARLEDLMGGPPVTGIEQWQAIVDALSRNYRVGEEELEALCLITRPRLEDVTAAFLGIQELIQLQRRWEWEKKRGNARLAYDEIEELAEGPSAGLQPNTGRGEV